MSSHWLVKQEPESYPWSQFVADGQSAWTGVRNFQARNNLRLMKKGDSVLYYHSGDAREVVGIAVVGRGAYPDPTAETEKGDWVAVDLLPKKPLQKPVTLATIKATEELKDIALVRNSRLSVMPLSRDAFERIVAMGKGKPDRTA